MKTISSFVIAVALLFGVMFGTSSIAKANDVDTVKDGVLAMDKTTTVGKAVGGYDFFTNVKWQSGEDKQGRKFVFFDAEFNDKAMEILNHRLHMISYEKNGVRRDFRIGDMIFVNFSENSQEDMKSYKCFTNIFSNLKFSNVKYHQEFVITNEGFKDGFAQITFLDKDDKTIGTIKKSMLSDIYKNDIDLNGMLKSVLFGIQLACDNAK